MEIISGSLKTLKNIGPYTGVKLPYTGVKLSLSFKETILQIIL